MAELNIFHYLPKNSVIHNLDGRIKLIGMILFAIATSITTQIINLTILTLVIVIILVSSKLPLMRMITEIRRFLFFIGIVVVVNSFSVPGTPIAGLPILGLSWEGLRCGVFYGWRLILIILISTILAGTTSLSLLKNVIEWFLRPAPFIRETSVATMFGLTFVLIPLVFDQASEMMEAQKARCIEGRKNPVKKVMFLIFPLLFQMLLRVDEMVQAMESRCYSDVRTKAVFKTNFNDWLFLIFSGLVCAVVFFNLIKI
ncbi:MAG: energy-coupling factor transporter transmembrane protein EcfT [Firmicutes bacterium]|nr:energy-coupling factor transporter transmembrane protein EcfT [Bacillota bacterium]